MKGGRGHSPDVLVVGGGVIGVSITEQLAGEGLDVWLLEAESTGSGASGAAAGMLAPIGEADGDSPLLRLGLESLPRFEALCERLRDETGIDPELEQSGLLHVAFSPAELEALERKHQGLERLAKEERGPGGSALELELVGADSPRLRAHDLARPVAGGLWSPREAHLRPPLLVRALEASARARGARVESGARVHRLRVEGGRVVGVESSLGTVPAGSVVLAAGVGTPELLRSSRLRGTRLAAEAIEPVRGQILSLEATLPRLSSIVWGAGIYLVRKRDGRWVIGATEERVGFDRRVTVGGVSWLLERAQRVFPALSEASFGAAWAGLRPVSRDRLPSIGGCREHPGLYLASGHGRNGVLLAPVTARLIADEVLGGARRESLVPDAIREAVRPDR
jgi:glycine oxidase